MEQEEHFPRIPKDLLDALNERFPEKTPSLSMSIDEIRDYGGRRAVVRFLNEQFDRQNETIINTKVL
jgi:hypothetical protein